MTKFLSPRGKVIAVVKNDKGQSCQARVLMTRSSYSDLSERKIPSG